MKTNSIQIKETTADDFNLIMTIERRAFGYDKEAELTAELLADPTAEPMVSLIAYVGDEPAGHILFTRAAIVGSDAPVHILAPLAVVPEFQKQGVGGALIEAGIEKLREMGSQLVFVLGHKEYYPRHGFIPGAGQMGYPAPYPIPDEYGDYWMVQPVGAEGFDVGKGQVKCCEAMDKPEHWRDDEADRG